MKKILFTLMIALFAAQSYAHSFSLGPYISWPSEAMAGDDAENFADGTASFGMAVGLNLQYRFSRTVSVHSGVGLQVNDYSWYEDTYYVYDENRQYVFLNLNVPVLVRMNFTRGFFAETGFDMNINLQAQYYEEDSYNDTSEWYEVDDWNIFQIGPSFGVGYRMWFGLEFSGRMSYGLLDAADTDFGADLKPLRFQIDISYWFLQ